MKKREDGCQWKKIGFLEKFRIFLMEKETRHIQQKMCKSSNEKPQLLSR